VRHEVHASTSSARKIAIVLLERLYDATDVPPLPLIDDVIERLGDDHPEVRVVAASFLRTHLPAGMPGALKDLARALERRERTTSLLVLEALRKHDTVEAKAILDNARAEPELAARAVELLDGFSPRTAVWTFIPKAPPGISPIRVVSPRASTVRGARVRVPDDTDLPPNDGIVEARFDERLP